MATPAIKIQFSLAGDLETLQLLRELPQKLVKGALRKSLRESAKIIQRGAKFRAPQKSGLLAKTIKVRAFKRTRKAVVGFTVGTAAGDYRGQTFYGGFQEYGWVPTGRHKAAPGIRSAMNMLRRQKKNKVNWLGNRKRDRDGNLIVGNDGKWVYDNKFSQLRLPTKRIQRQCRSDPSRSSEVDQNRTTSRRR